MPLPHFHLQIFFRNFHARRRIEIHAAHFAAISDQRNLIRLHRPAWPGARARLAFNAQQLASQQRSVAAANFQSRPAQCAEELRGRRPFAQRQPQRCQSARQRRFGVVVDTGDAAAGEIQDGQRLQDIIQLCAGEVHVNFLAPTYTPEVLEIANAVLVEHDAAHGQLRRC